MKHNREKNKRRKKFFNREIILEKLLTAGETSANILLGLTLEFFDVAKAMTRPGPHAAQRALRKRKMPHVVEIDLKSKIAFWSLLSKLKKEGLIAKRENTIALTERGKKYLQKERENPSLRTNKKYIIKKTNINSSEIILIIFDIPEKESRKRKWLRFQLRQFNFQVLQKSVWWGTAGFPKEFLRDLKKYEIFPYVHIFSVKKKGTISTVIDDLTIQPDRIK
jgi:hypothetical protein